LNWIPETPTSSDAFAETITEVPETLELLFGTVTETVGDVLSAATVYEIVKSLGLVLLKESRHLT
jgi:hypothetical protein